MSLDSTIFVTSSRYGDRIVAIKVLNNGNTSAERAAIENRFAREVTMMSKVKHDNLVKVSLLIQLVSYEVNKFSRFYA